MFDNCESLREINIPKSVKRIGEYAFRDCNKALSEIKIPSSVEFIGDGAFYCCSNLVDVDLSNETNLGMDVFSKTLWIELYGLRSILINQIMIS